jgi:hypothetical protein
MRSALLLVFISLLTLINGCAGACTPGSMTCAPNKVEITQHLESYYPDLRIKDLRYDTRYFSSPSDGVHRFRVNFEGSGVLTRDAYSEFSYEDYQALCHAEGAYVGNRILRVSKRAGETLQFYGDTAASAADGKWQFGANLRRFKGDNGSDLFLSTPDPAINPDLRIVPEDNIEQFCKALIEASR